MSTHRLALGTVITCGHAVLVVLAAIAVLVQPSTVVAVAPLALLAVIIAFGVTELGSQSAQCSRTPLSAVSATAIEFYSRGMSLAGLIVLTGRAALSILIFLILCEAALWWTRGQLTHGWLRVGDYPTGDPLTPLCPLHSASTAQMCRRWRATYLRLEGGPGPIVLERIASLRRELLAEFQRRDPAGFAKFLQSRDPAKCYPARLCRPSTGTAELPAWVLALLVPMPLLVWGVDEAGRAARRSHGH